MTPLFLLIPPSAPRKLFLKNCERFLLQGTHGNCGTSAGNQPITPFLLSAPVAPRTHFLKLCERFLLRTTHGNCGTRGKTSQSLPLLLIPPSAPRKLILQICERILLQTTHGHCGMNGGPQPRRQCKQAWVDHGRQRPGRTITGNVPRRTIV